MRKEEEQRNWMMFVGASLAGGQTAKMAIQSADQVAEAVKSRFDAEEEDDD